MTEITKNNKSEKSEGKIGRRDVIKALATVPVAGAFFYALYKKNRYTKLLKYNIAEHVKLSAEATTYKPIDKNSKKIRIGIIGFGIRGKQLARAAGFAHPKYIDQLISQHEEDRNNDRHKNFLDQEDLNIEITGVCDVFDTYGEEARETAANLNREGVGGKMGSLPQRYRTYKELIHSDDIDAVIIAAPDHWHGPMTIEAAKAAKHVYCEKPLTWTVAETFEVRKAIKETGVVFQLGHQGRQTESYYKAREAIQKDVLGNVNLIEVTTNRNSPNGAWVYPIHEDANPNTIDWKQFIGQAPWHDFSLERFFRWRCWWDYSTGLSGDLLTHEYDAMNQILDLGIPNSASSSGGIYFFKDGRTVPDVLHTVFEYPDKDLSFMYSASLASNRRRGRTVMGNDAYMELGISMNIYADSGSIRYKEKIKQGLIDVNTPIYSFDPGRKQPDAITSATEKYFAGRGLLYTYRGGKRVDTTHLHIKEWLEGIRTGRQCSCNIDVAFEEAITAHMGTKAYKENRTVFWDSDKEEII